MKTTTLTAMTLATMLLVSGCFSYKNVDREPASRTTTTVQRTHHTPATTTTVTQ
ncbi:MAG: hypothetical protein ABI615_02025 [Chthoniobacterales bacterium]